jgi:hypothetical protein
LIDTLEILRTPDCDNTVSHIITVKPKYLPGVSYFPLRNGEFLTLLLLEILMGAGGRSRNDRWQPDMNSVGRLRSRLAKRALGAATGGASLTSSSATMASTDNLDSSIVILALVLRRPASCNDLHEFFVKFQNYSALPLETDETSQFEI